MIPMQLGAFFGGLLQDVVTPALRAVTPTLLSAGNQFLQRELNRKSTRAANDRLRASAVQALNTPGIAVARVGGTTQPVGGRVQRSTFTPAALTPAQTPIGNIPLVPAGFPRLSPSSGIGFPAPMFGGRLHTPPGSPLPGGGFAPVANPPMLPALVGARGEPRFARDEFGKTVKFVPSPRPGEGFITVLQARQLGLSPTRPFWRFNRLEGQFEKMKSRRMNPFNFKATKRAGRRVEATLDAVKELVRIERKMTSGKVRLKKKKRKR